MLNDEVEEEKIVYLCINKICKCMYLYKNNKNIHINIKYVDICINTKVCRCIY